MLCVVFPNPALYMQTLIREFTPPEYTSSVAIVHSSGRASHTTYWHSEVPTREMWDEQPTRLLHSQITQPGVLLESTFSWDSGRDLTECCSFLWGSVLIHRAITHCL